jgi:hypothetical protein
MRIKLSGNNLPEEALLILKSNDIKLSRNMPVDSSLNIFRSRIEEIIPSEYGMEISLNAGDIFYANVSWSDYEGLNIKENEEIWTSFPVCAGMIIYDQPDLYENI